MNTLLFWIWEILGWASAGFAWFGSTSPITNKAMTPTDSAILYATAIGCWAMAAAFNHRIRLDWLESRLDALENQP